MTDTLLKRAQILTSASRLLVRAAKMERDQKASKRALAPTYRKLDEVLQALTAKRAAKAEIALKEARTLLAALRRISQPRRRVSKQKMH
jgi:hypothetical protein